MFRVLGIYSMALQKRRTFGGRFWFHVARRISSQRFIYRHLSRRDNMKRIIKGKGGGLQHPVTPEMAERMKSLAAEGWGWGYIGKQLGVSGTCVSRHVRGYVVRR